MPNWCQNTLAIEGDSSEIAKFREWLNDQPLTLQKIHPMPKELEDTISPTPDWSAADAEKAKILQEKYGADNWYDWHVKNWGTKWDIEAEEVSEETDDRICFSFESAWSPPEAAIKKLGVMFPSLDFSLVYREDGMGFAGILKIKGDEWTEASYDSKDREGYRQFILDEFGDDPFEVDFA